MWAVLRRVKTVPTSTAITMSATISAVDMDLHHGAVAGGREYGTWCVA